MSNDKRRAGRPRGTGKDDSQILARIADLLVAEPALKPTTAIKRAIRQLGSHPESDDTLVRRLQDKWKAQGSQLLADARKRAAPEEKAGCRDIGVSSGYGSDAFGSRSDSAAVLSAMRFEANLNRISRQLEFMDIGRRLAEQMESPVQKMIRQFEEQQRWIRDAVDPPYLRVLRDMARW